MLENILRHAEESFEFSKSHYYLNANLFIITLFNLQIQLERHKDEFKNINLSQIIDEWLRDLQKRHIIGTYEGNLVEGYFYVYPKHENWKAYSSDYKLLLPTYNENIIA